MKPRLPKFKDRILRLVAGARTTAERCSSSASIFVGLDLIFLAANFRLGGRNTDHRQLAGAALFARRQSDHEGSCGQNENELFHFGMEGWFEVGENRAFSENSKSERTKFTVFTVAHPKFLGTGHFHGARTDALLITLVIKDLTRKAVH